MTARVAQGLRGSRLISVARFLKHCRPLHHVRVRCACHLFLSYCFISDLFSVTTFSLLDTFGCDQEVTFAPLLTGVECPAAWPIRLHTQERPQVLCDANDEHTPINFTDSNWIFPHHCIATTAVTTEDPEGLHDSGASSSKKLAAASTVPTVLGSSGNCFWQQMADYESVDSRCGIRETCANLDTESVVSTLFRSESKEKKQFRRPRRNNGSAEIA